LISNATQRSSLRLQTKLTRLKPPAIIRHSLKKTGILLIHQTTPLRKLPRLDLDFSYPLSTPHDWLSPRPLVPPNTAESPDIRHTLPDSRLDDAAPTRQSTTRPCHTMPAFLPSPRSSTVRVGSGPRPEDQRPTAVARGCLRCSDIRSPTPGTMGGWRDYGN
jgi:hypothetical protein